MIDTTDMTVYELREQIRERVAPRTPGTVSILIESFGYKNGLPPNADFVFDVRCLPNPYWELSLRRLNGKDAPVKTFLDAAPARAGDDRRRSSEFLHKWIPRYQDFAALLPHGRDRLHGRDAPLGLRRRSHREPPRRRCHAIRTHHNELR